MKAAIATSSAEPPVAEPSLPTRTVAAWRRRAHHAKKKSRAGERHDAGEDELDVGDVAQIYADLEAEEESLDAEALQ
ncbi:hypothetical protein SO694_000392130 [Aureococcus anophagefferens]|uniref:Uncharacterized protein n=1 Tax=Aureococcus anophagefferens TaxID=44056 RepID=A0ABR1FLR5_AURAN